MSRIDIQREVTDRIIAAIEKGGLSTWIKPWVNLGRRDSAIPYNFLTGKRYQGFNSLYFSLQALEAGFQRNAWLTFNQAKQLGGMVQKGSKGVLGVKYVTPDRPQQPGMEADAAEDTSARSRLIPVPFHVFNVEQIDGLELPDLGEAAPVSEDEAVCAVETLVRRQQANTNLGYKRSGDRACYNQALDLIKMPEGSFNTPSHYAATLAHELVHATGHAKRLDRRAAIQSQFKDHHEAYAFEELVAEIGAAFICAELGVVGEHLQHENYIDSWLNALKRDKRLIFTASRYASSAHLYVMNSDTTSVTLADVA